MMLEEFHGVAQYDHAIVSYLELMKQPYTGCNPRGLMLTHDKSLTKKILKPQTRECWTKEALMALWKVQCHFYAPVRKSMQKKDAKGKAKGKAATANPPIFHSPPGTPPSVRPPQWSPQLYPVGASPATQSAPPSPPQYWPIGAENNKWVCRTCGYVNEKHGW